MKDVRPLHPGLSARAWLNVMPVTKLTDSKSIQVDVWRDGIWFVCVSGSLVLASYVPFEPSLNNLPNLEVPTSQHKFSIGEVDKVTATFMKPKWDAWKKADYDAGMDEYTLIGNGPIDDDSLPGLSKGSVRFSGPTEHVDATLVERVEYPWDTEFRSIGTSERSMYQLHPDTMVALSKVDGCYKPVFRHGTGSHDFVLFEPMANTHPYVIGKISSGERDSSDEDDGHEEKSFTLKKQTYVEDTDEYVDDETSGDETLASQAARSILEAMGD